MSDVSLQLQLTTGGTVLTGEPVLFNQSLSSFGNIGYNPAAGEITLNEPGYYIFEWWVATQSTTASTAATAFSLRSSEGDILQAMTPVKAGQLSGNGIFNISSAPVTVSLNNDTAGTIYFPSNATVQAGMVVSGYLSAFGGRASAMGTFGVTGGADPVIVPMTETTAESANVDYSEENAIIIEQAGVYRVEISFIGSISGIGSPSQNFSVGLYKNGALIPETGLFQSISMVENQNTTFAVSDYVRFEKGDVLRLMVSTAPDDATIFFPSSGPGATLRVQRVM